MASPFAVSPLAALPLAAYVEYTLLRPGCTTAEVQALCATAIERRYVGVCVPSGFVQLARAELRSAAPRLVTVVGFPFGYANLPAKRYEAEQALRDGAQDIDLVANHSLLRSGQLAAYAGEIHLIGRLVQAAGCVLKVIIEVGLLSDEEIAAACGACASEGADYVKTSSGFAGEAASVAQVARLRELLPAAIRLKASGGIRTAEQAEALIAAGADRIGTSALL